MGAAIALLNTTGAKIELKLSIKEEALFIQDSLILHEEGLNKTILVGIFR
jgi:hypothetical protein